MKVIAFFLCLCLLFPAEGFAEGQGGSRGCGEFFLGILFTAVGVYILSRLGAFDKVEAEDREDRERERYSIFGFKLEISNQGLRKKD